MTKDNFRLTTCLSTAIIAKINKKRNAPFDVLRRISESISCRPKDFLETIDE
ncbi:helix-turn-helix domain-containing protein [Corynebacterium mayonis]|uniref:helix-turn-helix domain-containing protein n=1 Tax=Corynebacterium mayonis TaxID=3062461 RepID=UPI003CC7FA42